MSEHTASEMRLDRIYTKLEIILFIWGLGWLVFLSMFVLISTVGNMKALFAQKAFYSSIPNSATGHVSRPSRPSRPWRSCWAAYDEAVKQLVKLVSWFKDRPKDERQSHHRKPPTMPMPWRQQTS